MAKTVGAPFNAGKPIQKWYSGQAAVLKYRDFRWLMGATFFNSFAYWVEQVALGWLVLELTDSTFMVGLTFAARMAPFLFLGIISGAVADRVDRRLFLRSLTAGIGLTWFLIAALIVTGKVQAWHLIALALVAGCMRAFFATTYSALIYDIVGPRAAVMGMAWSSILSHGAGLVGAVLAGVIVMEAGPGAAYLASGGSFVVSFLLIMFMREQGQAAPRQRETITQNLKGAVHVLRTNKVLTALAIQTAAMEALGYSSSVLLPTLARDVLHVGAEGLGLMTGVRAGAGIIGPLFLSSMSAGRPLGKMLFISAGFFGLAIIAIGFAPTFALALLAMVAFNGTGSVLDILTKTMMQACVSNEERGRAMGAWVWAIGIGPLGQMELGGVANLLMAAPALGAALGVGLALTIHGGGMLLVTLGVFLAMPKLRKL